MEERRADEGTLNFWSFAICYSLVSLFESPWCLYIFQFQYCCFLEFETRAAHDSSTKTKHKTFLYMCFYFYHGRNARWRGYPQVLEFSVCRIICGHYLNHPSVLLYFSISTIGFTYVWAAVADDSSIKVKHKSCP